MKALKNTISNLLKTGYSKINSNSLNQGLVYEKKKEESVLQPAHSSLFLSLKELEKSSLFTKLSILSVLNIVLFFSCGVKNNSAQISVISGGKVIINKTTDSAYVLFAPANSDTTYLIDKAGNVFHYWVSKYAYTPGMSVYLLPNGNLLRAENVGNKYCGFPGGQISVYNWDDNLLWSYTINSPNRQQTHDVYPMPNGNVLAVVWEFIPKKVAEAKGRRMFSCDSAGIWSGALVELEPDFKNKTAKEVWHWSFWDRVVSTGDSAVKFPQLLNVNYIGTPDGGDTIVNGDTIYRADTTDWTHMNAVTYNADLDQIMISSRNLNEIYIIEHTKDKCDSKLHSGGQYGKGGDFLYRWGYSPAYLSPTPNPKLLKGVNLETSQQLFGQHSPYWIPKGYPYQNQIMINNDGYDRSGGTIYGGPTTVNIIEPGAVNGNYPLSPNATFYPTTYAFNYQAPNSLWNSHRGNAQMLRNGHILICSPSPEPFNGDTLPPTFYEINPMKSGEIVWEYQLPKEKVSGGAFRCTQYDAKYINTILGTRNK